MKKVYTLLFASATFLTGIAGGQSKFDAPSLFAIDQYKQVLANPGHNVPANILPFEIKPATARSAAQTEASAIVTLNLNYGIEDIEKFGLTVTSSIEDMAIATGSIEAIEALAESDVVKSLSLGTRAYTRVDRARQLVGMDKIHAGTGLPRAYTGKGVITGLYDNGMDPNHIAFFTDNDATNGTMRVKRLWQYSSSTPVGYDTPSRLATFTTDNAYNMHGTHVLGLMAGSYNGKGGRWANTTNDENFRTNPNQIKISVSSVKPNPFYGMATESDIVVGCGNPTSANILDGVSRMVSYAKAQGQPIVVNLSLGNGSGPHDGTDAFSTMLDKYAQDAIICVASGNEADLDISVVKTLTASDKTAKTFIKFAGTNSNGIIDIWASNNKDVKFSVCVYDLTKKSVVYEFPVNTEGTKTLSATTSTQFAQAFASSTVSMSRSNNTTTNNRANMLINYNLRLNSKTNADGNLVLGLIAEGTPGTRIDMVNSVMDDEAAASFSSLGQSGWSDGNAELSINGMGCGKNIISVGAYNSREVCGYINNVYSYYTYVGDELLPGCIASYSSHGVTVDGRSLPIVCAPGTGIIGPISTPYVNKNMSTDDLNYVPARLDATHKTANGRLHVWDWMQGTSMATPIVSGAIATWLEADPSLTHVEVADYIRKSAKQDDKTVTSGNPVQWGAGKFDAYEGLKLVLSGGAGVNDVVVNPSNVLVNALGGGHWEAFDGSASDIKVDVYNLAGAKVMAKSAAGNTLQFDASQLGAGVYVVNVNGKQSQKIVVK